jgi:hypothetical protein
MGGSTTREASLAVRQRRHVVVVPAGGRLGNQVFQYAALRAALPEDPLLLVDFDEFDRTFIAPRTRAFRSERIADRIVLSFLHRVGRLPGVGLGEIRQAHDTNLPAWTRDGRIVTSLGYYQAGAPQTLAAAQQLRFRSEVVAGAETVLPDGPGPIAFVHLRRGDYLTWPSEDGPAALPDAWYVDGIRRVRAVHPGIRFVVVSDDPTYASEVLVPAAGLPDTTRVSRASSSVDLAVMARCDAGILSASTLSWWGGAMAAAAGGPGPFLAPERWLGFRGTERYPHAIGADFLTFVEVDH